MRKLKDALRLQFEWTIPLTALGISKGVVTTIRESLRRPGRGQVKKQRILKPKNLS